MTSSSRSRDRHLPLWKKGLFAAIVTAFFFGFFELSLSLLGVERSSSKDDPFVGFSSYLPLVEKEFNRDGVEQMVTAENKLHWFNHIAFTPKKPKNTYRIFCVGGSTTYGHPYWDNTSYSRWMREFLPLIDSEKSWEVINAGGISYASYRVANVMEELSQYEPDLFLVYSAQNEFLERRTYASMFDQPSFAIQASSILSKTRTWSFVQQGLEKTGLKTPPLAKREVLSAEVDEILNHTIGPVDYQRDPEWRKNVVGHYEANLERMIRIADGCGAKIAFVMPSSNLKDCSPFKSAVDPTLDEEPQVNLYRLFENGKQNLARGETRAAEKDFRACLKLDPGLAEASFRLAKICFHDERFEEAKQYFDEALNSDVCPLRAVKEITDHIRRASDRHHVPLIDFESRLRGLCRNELGHECLGEEYFLDHVHPTVDVHRRLALWIIEELQHAKLLPGELVTRPENATQLDVIRVTVESELDFYTQGVALRNLAKTMHWAGRYEESAPLAEKALEHNPNDAECRFVLADSLKNLDRVPEALEQYARLVSDHSDYDRAYHPYGELLARNGNWKQAKVYLLLAHFIKPENSNILYWLGLSHLELGEYDLAMEALEKVNQLYPNDPSTLFFLAQAKGNCQQFSDAIAILDLLVAQGYDSPAVQEERQVLIERQASASDKKELSKEAVAP